MASTNITIYDYLQSEFIRSGKNEFYDEINLNNPDENYGLTFDVEENAFMNKILGFDQDTQDVINKRIFRGMKLTDSEADRIYKQMFLMRYMNQQIGFQTIEEFASRIMFLFSTHKQYLDFYHKNLTDMLEKKARSTSTGSSKNTGSSVSSGDSNTDSTSRHANVTLPQNEPSMDLNSTLVTFADDTTADLNRTNSGNTNESSNESDTTNNSENTSVSYSLDELNKIRNIIGDMIKEYEKSCFLLVW